MITVFMWELRKVDEVREIFLADRFVFIIQREIGKEQLFLPYQWADVDFARRRAIVATEKAEIEGLTLWSNVFTYTIQRNDEDLMKICDDWDDLAVIKLMALTEAHGKPLT